MFIPAFCLISGTGSTEYEPLALGPEVGLHGSVPLLPVGASENQDHLVESTGHSDKSCWESMESASECDIGQTRKGNTPSTGESTFVYSCLTSMVPEGKSLMGKGMLLHQSDDVDADRGHS